MHNDNLARVRKPLGRTRRITASEMRKFRNASPKTRINVGNVVKLTTLLLVFVCGSILVLSRNVMVTEQSRKVAELKREYSMLETENRKREIAISQKVDIATVEEYAISNCNMNRARQEQIMYVDVRADDYGVVVSREDDENGTNGFKKGLLAYLK